MRVACSTFLKKGTLQKFDGSWKFCSLIHFLCNVVYD
jgi:hypothetical protein